MTSLMDRDVVCPVCDNAFRVQFVGSTNTFGGVDSDLRTHPVGWDPLAMMVITCRQCRYSADGGEFEAPVPAATAYRLRELADRVLPADLFAAHNRPLANPPIDGQRGHLAAELMELAGRDPLDVGWMWLRASWLATDAEDAAAADAHRRRSIAAFRRFQALIPRSQEAVNATYLIGELSRRVSDFATACEYLEQVPAESSRGPIARKMLARARAQDASPAKFEE